MLTQNLNVRADKKSVVPVAHMVQGDSGRRLTCIVQDYDIPSGSSASLSVERPDGNVYIASATISNNNVSAMITSTMLEVVGIVKGTMRITSSGSVVSTFEFVIKVEEAAGAGIEPSSADGNVYVYINGEKVKVVTDPDLEAAKSELSESIVEISEQFETEKKVVPSSDITVYDNKYWNPTDGVRLSDDANRVAYSVNASPNTNYDIGGRYVGVASGYDVWFFDSNGNVIEKLAYAPQTTVDGESYHTLFKTPQNTATIKYTRSKTSDVNSIRKETISKVKGLGEVEERLSEAETDIEKLQKSSATEGVSGLSVIRNNIPVYFKAETENPSSFSDFSYIDSKIASIPNGKSYVFFTDTHWDWGTNAQNSINLIEYVKGRKGIKNVMFGGDFINEQSNKYLANQVLQDFAIKCKNAFGNGFLPILGNHDTNMAGYNSSQGTVESKYLPFYVTQNAMMELTPTVETEWDFVKDKVRSFTTDATKLKDLEGYFKWCYTYDDDANKIHHIILNGSSPNYGTVADVFGSDDIRLHIEWFYRALMQTKDGYDVSVGIHMIGKPHDMTVTAMYIKIFVLMAMGLKTKTNKQTYINRSTDVLYQWYPYTTQTHDFRNANNIGKVFFIAGHSHCDGISVIGQSADTFNNFTVKEYVPNYVIDQVTVTANNGCEIPIIWTTTDAYGRYGDWVATGGDPIYEVPMQKDTVTEQAFDVITLVEDGIDITRFGAGNDRFVKMNS